MIFAAREIALQRGAGRVTLEAVAETIGSTKGAVLHAFPNKPALLEELLRTMCEEWDRRFDEVQAKGNASPLSAYIETWEQSDPQGPSYLEAVAVAKAEDPRLLEPVRGAYQRYAKLIAPGGAASVDTMVAWMACEGLVLLELLGLHRFDQDTKAAFFSRLHTMAKAEVT
ncbi:TetR/AcrR family transcriptional regulator (plasmid) [Rhizobium sp. WSM1274]|uniref:TetR/AcrR family transcriptional regulator n=1 Tax=Rhizobium sp. WSM1274 TaxID=3138254 RepID=UPI0021A3766C|nr:TetR/AcrR family transcriptional regulator [Rhizobium leguminosarum]UWU30869.1 TetR/AcrR family transcriptional regulator [Rhizobium leguminosarum bv. viciae]